MGDHFARIPPVSEDYVEPDEMPNIPAEETINEIFETLPAMKKFGDEYYCPVLKKDCSIQW